MGTSPITLGVGNGAARRLLLFTPAQGVAPPAQDQPPHARQAEFVICEQTIELAFKRLKSLMGLEEIDAKEPRLARAAVCAKLILAILTESLIGRVLALSPTF
jgi:hypothetical protein